MLRGAAGAAVVAGAAAVLPGTATADPADTEGLGHGRHAFRVPRDKISIQLWTVRTVMATDLVGTVSALADLGYRKVETAGFHGRTAAEFRAILNRHRIRATSSHMGIDGDINQVIADAKALGNTRVVVPFVDLPTIAQWREFTARLEAAGKVFRRAGLSLGYHNHAHEFARIDGVRPFDVITRGTTRRNVHLEVDLYWVATGGADSIRVYWENFPRVEQYHVKDRAPDGSFADLGTGNIDFRRIFRATHAHEVDEYIVEHDTPPNPLATAQVGYQYLANLRF